MSFTNSLLDGEEEFNLKQSKTKLIDARMNQPNPKGLRPRRKGCLVKGMGGPICLLFWLTFIVVLKELEINPSHDPFD